MFKDKVLKIVKDIPRGEVLTYKKVAELAGNKNAVRAVGNILNYNFKNKQEKIPCHRVVKSDSSIGGYAAGIKNKGKLLIAEGIKIKNHKINSNK